MKKYLSDWRWDDKTKMILAAGLTGVVLLFAILFPLSFLRNTPQEAAADTKLERKAELFICFRNGGADKGEISAEKLETPKKSMAASCEARMQGLIAACINDERLEDPAPVGCEYTIVSDGEGSMTVCRMWLEQKGDWQNWLDVFFDAETGELYYLYLSKECLENQDNYGLLENVGSESIQNGLIDRLDGKLLYSGEDTSGIRTAIISTKEGTICYTIDCTCYGGVVDVKINCF